MVIKDFDTVFLHIGGFGRYQWILFAIVSYMNMILAFVYFGQLFMSLTPPHWCRPPSELDALNLPMEEIKKLTIPLDSEMNEYSKCTRYDVDVDVILRNMTNSPSDTTWNITTCSYGWTYDYSLYYPSITSQLNWVCDEDWKPPFSQSLFFVGSVVGVPFFGWAADKWGRLPVIVSTNMMGGIAGIASAFSNSFVTFTVLRFIVGLTYDTMHVVAYILVMEYVSSDYRTVMANVPIMIFLTAGMCAMPWIAYFLKDWSLFTIAMHAPQLLCFFFIWILPESGRWLLSQGRMDDTVKIIKRAAKLNNKTLTPAFFEDFKEYGETVASDNQTAAGVLDLLKTPVLRKRFIVLCVMWVMVILAYDGHMRNTENIGYDVFISFTVLGFVELPADFVTILSIEWLGRRHTTVFTLLLTGLAGLVIAVVPQTEVNTIFAIAIAGRFMITMSINVALQYVVEVLPTVARSSGTGAIHTLGAAATFLSPYVIYLGKYGYYLPYVILGFVAILGGCVSTLLPETKDEKLPDSLEDGETYFTDQGCCYNPCHGRKTMRVTPINDVPDGKNTTTISLPLAEMKSNTPTAV